MSSRNAKTRDNNKASQKGAPSSWETVEEDNKLFSCEGREGSHLSSCIVSFFLMFLIALFLVILLVLYGSVVNNYRHLVFLTDRLFLDTATEIFTAFVVINFVSLFLEVCLWCARAVNVCYFKVALAGRFLVFITSIGLFAGYLICMNNYVDREQLEMSLKKSLQFYRGEYFTDPFSAAWNSIQVQYETCGVNGPADYMDTPWFHYHKPQYVPTTCCQKAGRKYEVEEFSYGSSPSKIYAQLTVTYDQDYVDWCNNLTLQSNINTSPTNGFGSLHKIHADLLLNVAHNGGMLALQILVLIIQLLLFFITCAVYCNFKQEEADKEAMERLVSGSRN